MAEPARAFNNSMASRNPWSNARSSFPEPPGKVVGFAGSGVFMPPSMSHSGAPLSQAPFAPAGVAGGHLNSRQAPAMYGPPTSYATRPASGIGNLSLNPIFGSYPSSQPSTWETKRKYSPTGSLDDIIASPNLSDFAPELGLNQSGARIQGVTTSGKRSSQRRPANRDEFDGPHQFLQRPPQDVLDQQERELPHLPTNLHVQEQDQVLTKVNERLSQCAFDFVAKYQFPIPLTQDMRPVERPQDREWTEWVYLLKRLATKRRIPARVLYSGQIKQLVTILENSLEMRHASKHQSRPLKDDRNILQLISAGIQVAKILKDASAMQYLDQLYAETEMRIKERTNPRYQA